MNKKKIIDWTSRILGIIGLLLALTACICLIIAVTKTETVYMIATAYYDGTNHYFSEGTYFKQLPLSLYKVSGYSAASAGLCCIVAKILPWASRISIDVAQ